MIYLLYIIFFFLILRFTVTLFNFISNPKLTKSRIAYQHLVSVLIPARNEEENILTLLNSLKLQDYTNMEVLILDDQSEDNTYKVCEQFCDENKQFRVIKGGSLPDGWLGKNYACHRLASEARGRYLLFLDADEEVKLGLINNALYRMQLGNLSLLSLFTNQITKTHGEKAVVPLMHFLLLNLLPLRLVKLSKMPSFAAASGQFMLFDATTYHQYQWHLQVKSKVVEDIEIMKRVKQEKLNGEALLANGYVYCRMYKSYSECLQGFSKNILAGFNNNVVALMFYIILVVLGPIMILLLSNFQLFYFAVTLIVLSRVMISLLSGQSVLQNVLYHPLQMLNLCILACSSIKKALSNKIIWKGRVINK